MIEAEIKRCGQFNIIHTASGLKIDIIPICHPELGSGSRKYLILLDAETSSEA
jgi:hypothetical protein